ncbi:unnamed protein product [Rotaria magnacalcarata]|uniref:Uncharacterized protein n=1 Tax=Rotaria magnacalcarata TaxID=392030 RepID=A0A816YK79_9BILA|nr:unnamed protein product [Rotaria magnacalcarata]
MTSVTQQARFPVLYDFDQDQALTKNTSKVGPIIQQPLQPRDNFPKGLRGGGPCFDCNNFQFKNFNNKGTIKFWRCANRSCGVLLHTSLNEEFLLYPGKVIVHTHLPNPAEVEIRNLRETMQQSAENEVGDSVVVLCV